MAEKVLLWHKLVFILGEPYLRRHIIIRDNSLKLQVIHLYVL